MKTKIAVLFTALVVGVAALAQFATNIPQTIPAPPLPAPVVAASSNNLVETFTWTNVPGAFYYKEFEDNAPTNDIPAGTTNFTIAVGGVSGTNTHKFYLQARAFGVPSTNSTVITITNCVP